MERRRDDSVCLFSLTSILPNSIFRVIGVPASTSYILTYDYLLNTALPPLVPTSAQSMIPLTAGILARSSIATITSPLELLRTNLQSTPLSSGNPHTLRSVLASLRTLVKSSGPLSLWRGLGPTLWRDVPFSGLYWASYEAWKKQFNWRGHEGATIAFFSGAISGTTAALVTSPFDTLKTRRQALIMTATNNSVTGTFPLLMQILKTEGAASLFAGIGPRMAKIAPACGIMIACYEVRYLAVSFSSTN
jgi:solute carrier family 25, member 39/40